MPYTIDTIEDAIITAIEAISAVSIRTVKTYNGELEADDLKRLTAPLPAVYVTYGGSEYTAHGARKLENIFFDLLVADKSLRAEEESRRGGAGNPGAYAMLAAIRDALCGEQLGLDISPLELVREDPVWFGQGVSIYAARYATMQPHLYT